MTALTDHAAIRRRILTHALDHPDDPIPFSLRLQREQGWSRARTARAIAEYRRFIELAMVAGHPVSPSPTVDAVWHLHLTDTRRYWDDFCPNVLGRLLHHDPSRGGVAERARHDDQYRRTLAAYARVFDVVPPEDIWPRQISGGAAPIRLALTALFHALGTWPRRLFSVGGTVIATLFVAGCAALYDSGSPGAVQGPNFIFGYLAAAMVAAIVTIGVQKVLEPRAGTPRVSAGELGAYELAYLAGGPDRVLWAAVLRLRQGGYLLRDLGTTRKRLKLGASLPSDSSPVEIGVIAAVKHDRLRGPASISAEIVQLREKLAANGLVAAADTRDLAWLAPVLVFGPLLLLGAVRLYFGYLAHRPVGFLLIVMLLQVIAAVALAGRPVGRSDGARKTLKAAQSALPLRKVGENDSQMARLVALYGLTALAGPAFADVRPLLPAMTSRADGGSSGTGCGGDGGGGCGGGCGGCGG